MKIHIHLSSTNLFLKTIFFTILFIIPPKLYFCKKEKNVVLPLSQWTIVPGNPSGTYMVTPATSGPQTFYRLRQ